MTQPTSDDTLTLTMVNALTASAITTNGQARLGVLRIDTPNGDTVNLALLPEQADFLATMMSQLAVELMVR